MDATRTGRGYEVAFQISFAALHLTYLVLGALAARHHLHRARRAWRRLPLAPGV